MKTRLFIIIVVPLAVFGLSLVLGPKIINPFCMDETAREILFSVRAPRSIVALLMGMALGASGAVFQGILRNPLADPLYPRHIERGIPLPRPSASSWD